MRRSIGPKRYNLSNERIQVGARQEWSFAVRYFAGLDDGDEGAANASAGTVSLAFFTMLVISHRMLAVR